MNDKIKQQYKRLLTTLIEEDDWLGARNLLDTVIQNAAITPPTISPPAGETPVVEQVPPSPPQPTDFDNERAARMAAKNN